MSFFNCTNCFLVHVFVIFLIVFVAHAHEFVAVEWADGRKSFVAEGEVLDDVCTISYSLSL